MGCVKITFPKQWVNGFLVGRAIRMPAKNKLCQDTIPLLPLCRVFNSITIRWPNSFASLSAW